MLFWPEEDLKAEVNLPLVMNLKDRHKIVALKKNTDIRKVLSSGEKVYTKFGIFFLSHKTTNNQMNFAVLIKKSVGNAVFRNYCKRIVRTYVRKNIDQFPQKSQVIFLYTYQGKINYHLLEEEFYKKLTVK